jgi:hypothetical protein
MRGYILLAMVLVVVAYVAYDLYRFTKASKGKTPDGIKVDAGGVLFVHGGKTYYQMPKGVRRKIADYPMDLRPGSPDMNMFTLTMDNARADFVKDKEAQRKEAAVNMRKIAKEEASRE